MSILANYEKDLQWFNPNPLQHYDYYFTTTGTQNKSYDIVQVNRTEDKVTIEVVLPGMSKENIAVAVIDDTLTIESKEDAKTIVSTHPLISSQFKQSFKISHNFDKEKVSAEMKDGVLKVVIPKIEYEKFTVKIE